MSNSSTNEWLALPEASLTDIRESILTPVRGLAFWTAITLPFLYLPLLAYGLESPATRLAFLALITCNAVALLIGHSYSRS
ncbi:hypothetical protein [Haloarcula halophila]|uniref:hypothetical protein n=1 Tax=Haloarcula TaxID=2237 RepID=UPI0023E3D644|nr:hypothetical protein [Halomicroarcula sp. DFY41]